MSKANARDLLVHEFGLVYATSAMNLEGMTQADSLVQPAGDANCANWILGHLVSVQNAVMGIVGAEPVRSTSRSSRTKTTHGPATSGSYSRPTKVARW